MNTFSRVLLVNVLLVLAYSIGAPAVTLLVNGGRDAISEGMVVAVVVAVLHVVVAFLAGFVLLLLGKKEYGLGMLVSAFAVFGIGSAAYFGLIFFQEALSR